jgi:hypothetical protein
VATLPSPEEKWLAVEERSSPEFSIGKKVQVGCEALRSCLFIYTKTAVLNGRVTCVSEDRERGFIVICVGENWLNKPHCQHIFSRTL